MSSLHGQFRNSIAAVALLGAALSGCGGGRSGSGGEPSSTSGDLIIDSFSPSSESTAVAGETIEFIVNARAGDPGGLTHQWSVDGIQQPSVEKTLLYDALEGSAEVRTVSVNVRREDGGSATLVWRIRVVPESRNQPPVITVALPCGPLEVNRGDRASFSVTASDPDASDRLSSTWYVNGQARQEGGMSFSLPTLDLALGEHRVEVVVTDGHEHGVGGAAAQPWILTVRADPILNRAPVIRSASPSGAARIPAGGFIVLSIEAQDSDGDKLAYRWSADGAVQPASGSSFRYSPEPGAPGTRSIQVTVDDHVVNSDSADPVYSWAVTVEGPEPSPAPAPTPEPTPDPEEAPPADPPGSAHIAWDPVTVDVLGNPESIAGYRIYVASHPEDFLLQSKDVSSPEAVLQDLERGTTYYVSITAWDVEGNESDLSDPIALTVQ